MAAYQRYAEIITASADSRTYRATLATDGVARDTHRILSWALRSNTCPVLFAHDASIPPPAKATNLIARGGNLVGDITFPPQGTFEFSDTLCALVAGGYLRGMSVSWLPGSWEYAREPGRAPGAKDFRNCDLLESSIVPVPSDVDALIHARGIDLRPLVDWAACQLDMPTPTLPRTELETFYRAATGGRKVHSMGKVARLPAAPVSPMWRSAGELFQVIARSCIPDAEPDNRLQRAPSGAFIGDPTSGGFLVPTEYATDLLGLAFEEAVIAPLVDRRTSDRPLADVRIPAIDETSRSDGSRWGGALSYWLSEGASIAGSFPRFRQLAFDAKKLIAICVVSNELLQDAPMLEAHLQRVFAAEISYQLDKAILTGSGVGVPQGVVNSSGTVQIAKDVGQASATITAANVSKMWSSLPPDSRARATWVINEDCEEQLEQMSYVVGTSGVAAPSATAMYMPAGQVGNQYPLLRGRPVRVVESAPALGTPGDVVLGDFSHYVLVSNEMKPALSTHVRFNNDEAVFRFSLRIDGQSVFASPITSGGKQRSPFVTLAAR